MEQKLEERTGQGQEEGDAEAGLKERGWDRAQCKDRRSSRGKSNKQLSTVAAATRGTAATKRVAKLPAKGKSKPEINSDKLLISQAATAIKQKEIETGRERGGGREREREQQLS